MLCYIQLSAQESRWFRQLDMPDDTYRFSCFQLINFARLDMLFGHFAHSKTKSNIVMEQCTLHSVYGKTWRLLPVV